MSYKCEGCHYDKTLNGRSYCAYYRETKANMDRDRGLKYLAFQHGKCSHDTREAADAIEELNNRIDFLMNCIYEAEDALDRGADNEWARAALEKAERGQDDI